MLGLSAGLLCACASRRADTAFLTGITAGAGTEVAVCGEHGDVVLDIRCRGGIGWTEVPIPAGLPPARIRVRLHLRGLEQLRCVSGGNNVQASVSSHGDLMLHQWKESGVVPGPEDQLGIVPVAASGAAPRIPLEGWFEVTLPKSCHGPGTFRLDWVDFYR